MNAPAPFPRPVDKARRVVLVLAGLGCLALISFAALAHWLAAVICVAVTPFFLLYSLIMLELFRSGIEEMKTELAKSRAKFWAGIAMGLAPVLAAAIAYLAGARVDYILLVAGLSIPPVWVVSVIIKLRMEKDK